MAAQVKQSTSFIVWFHRLLDVTIPVGILNVIGMFYPVTQWGNKYQLLGILGGLLLVIFNQGFGVYSSWRGRSLLAGFKLVVQAWGFTWLALLTIAFLLKDSSHFSRIIITFWAISTPFVLFLYRFTVRYLMGLSRARGWNTKRAVIIGAGDLGQRLADTLHRASMLGYMPIAFYDDNPSLKGKNFIGVPVVGDIDSFIEKHHYSNDCDEVYVTLPLRSEARIKEVLNSLANSTVTVKFIPDCFTFDLLHSTVTDIGGIPVISVYDTPLNNLTNKIIKRTEDIILSLIILLLISPLLFVIAIGVKLTSPGPILFKQTRIGWNGKPFTIFKFRSMPVDTDNKGTQWGQAKEKTTTKFGSFIRKTSIDELPQFFNTLIGDMSIVGPRPERDVFVEQFRKEIPRYMQKHLVKAGITGWAQVNGWRGDTSLDKRVQFDLYYIDNWTIWLDLKIIVLTVIKGFIDKNAY